MRSTCEVEGPLSPELNSPSQRFVPPLQAESVRVGVLRLLRLFASEEANSLRMTRLSLEAELRAASVFLAKSPV